MVLNTRNTDGLPLITVITAVYNGEKYIEQTIQSVLGQTYSNIQYIIIDGGSSDNTVDVIRKYQDSLSWISEKDKGVYDAWNKGLKKAAGDWIVFLGSDDYFWNKNVIMDALGSLEEASRQRIRVIYGKVNLISEAGKLSETVGQPWHVAKEDFGRFMSVIHCGAFHARSLFSDNGLFNPAFRIAGDYEFLLREFTKGREFLFLDRIIAGMRTGGLSANANFRLTVAREEKLAQSMNGISAGFNAHWKIAKSIVLTAISKALGQETANILLSKMRSLKNRRTEIDKNH